MLNECSAGIAQTGGCRYGIGTFLDATSKETAHIVVGGADYYCNIDPRISLAKFKKGIARTGSCDA